MRRYEKSSNYRTYGSCSEPAEETPVVWRYRYNAGAERELKWLQSADILPDFAKNWTYYQLGADKRQHGIYNGRATVAPDLCSNMGNRVHWFPTEYLTYGLGGTPLISYKPFAEDGEIYYIADHLGNTRVTLTSNGNITSAKDYEPFGKELHSNGNDRLTFIGKEQDAESDLGDFGVRKYEADIFFRVIIVLYHSF
ncbi:MAG: hypothetical protein LC116_07635 [Bacteroidetes bacterium]|nr:hypothetical protein [Bacteroidota bacterium]